MVMKKILIMSFFVMLATSASGGLFTDITLSFPDDPLVATHSWSWDEPSQTVTLNEVYNLDAPDRVIFDTVADGDPIFHINKTIQNNNAHTWTQYKVNLSGDSGEQFDLTTTPTSSMFGLTSATALELVFDAPLAVAVSEFVTFDFDILTPAGSYTFEMTQEPIPEPATMCLLGLGGLAMLRRRRA
jgi:hypothetical protein